MTGRYGPRAVLIGPPGAGKSTVARALAARLGVEARDTDADVERTAGRSISDLFVDEGEARFRELEREAVLTALDEHDGVLALGGGAVLDPRTEQSLVEYGAQGGTIVFLDVSLAHAAPRVGFNQARPLLLGNPRAQWQALMDARRPVYSRLATLHVVTDDRRPAQIAAEIAEALAPTSASAPGPATADAAAPTTSEEPDDGR